MSDTVTPATPAINSDPSTNQAPPAAAGSAPNAAAPAQAAKPPEGEPSWLKERLDRERRTALKSVGFESEADAKAAAEAAKAAAEAKKTLEQKALEASQQVAAEKARADALLAVATEQAARMMVGLTAEQQAAVKAIAGDDPAKQLQAIGALTPTWAKAAEASAQANANAAPKVATTAPPASAPNGNAPAQPPARSVYETTRQSNPFAAAAFGLANPTVYEPK